MNGKNKWGSKNFKKGNMLGKRVDLFKRADVTQLCTNIEDMHCTTTFLFTPLIFCIISSTTKVVTSRWAFPHMIEYIIEYIFQIGNHLVMKFGQIRNIIYGKCFRKYFARFAGLIPEPRPLLNYQQPNTIKNQCCWVCDFYALRQSNIVNIVYLKLRDHITLPFYQNHKRAWN